MYFAEIDNQTKLISWTVALGLVSKDTISGARIVGMDALATWRRFVLHVGGTIGKMVTGYKLEDGKGLNTSVI